MSHTPEHHAAVINAKRRNTLIRLQKNLQQLAKMPQPVTAAQAKRAMSCHSGNVGHKLTIAAALPWVHVESLPDGKYNVEIDVNLKNLCDSYQPGTYTESAQQFLKRIRPEIVRRRKEVEIKSHGSWVPDQISKMDLVRILNWIEHELENFSKGQSVNGRDDAKTLPQLFGQGVTHDKENQL